MSNGDNKNTLPKKTLNEYEIINTSSRDIGNIIKDLQRISEVYRLITKDQLHVLSRDIAYLLLDNIAKEIKLHFYPPGTPEKLLFSRQYTHQGVTKLTNSIQTNNGTFSGDVHLDLFISFTSSFLSFEKEVQLHVLSSTELDWHAPGGNDTQCLH